MKALKRHQLNFYDKYLENPEKKRRQREFASAFYPVFIAAAIVLCAVLSLMYHEAVISAEFAAQREIISSGDMRAEAELAVQYSEGENIFSEETDRIALFKMIRSSYPEIGTAEIEAVIACSPKDMSITDISCTQGQGTLVFTLQVQSVEGIPDYVRSLKETGLFEDVTYSGYTEESDGVFIVNAVMKREPVYEDSSFFGNVNDTVSD